MALQKVHKLPNSCIGQSQGMRLLVGLLGALSLLSFARSEEDAPEKAVSRLVELTPSSINAFIDVPDVVLVYYYSPQPDVRARF